MAYMVENSQDLEKQEMRTDENQQIDAGRSLMSWETWEFPPQDRSMQWYAVIIITGLSLIVYAIMTNNPLFALILVMMGVMLLINSLHQPKRVQVHLTTAGVVFGDKFWEYEEIRDFALVYRPGVATVLYIDFKKWYMHPQAIEMENANPLMIREVLSPVIPENFAREDEILTDILQKVYKL
jgi:hypothetical protein